MSRDLHVPGASSEGLLIKYTRRSQPNAEAEPIFTACKNITGLDVEALASLISVPLHIKPSPIDIIDR